MEKKGRFIGSLEEENKEELYQEKQRKKEKKTVRKQPGVFN